MKTKSSIKLFLIPAILFAVFFVFGNEAKAAEYFVDVDGVHGGTCSESNPGTSWTSPFCTIQKAVDTIPNFNTFTQPITIIVADGTYTDSNRDDNVVLIQYKEPTSEYQLTITSENKHGAKLSGIDYLHGGTGILAYGLSYTNIQNFEFLYLNGDEIVCGSKCNNINISGNYIHHIGHYPPSAPYVNDRCYSDREYYESGACWPHSGAHCGILGDFTNSIFDKNIFHTIGKMPGGFNIWQWYNMDHGMYVKGENNTITNSIFYLIEAGWGIQITGGDGWKIVNNTFDGPNPNPNEGGGEGKIVIVPQAYDINNTLIENNIFYNVKTSCIFFFNQASTENTVIKNNLANIATLSTCELNCPVSITSSGNIMSRDPKFINAANRDFHLQAGSPAIGAGLFANAPTYDFDGNLRTGNPDIGAYEYIPGDDTTPPSAPSGLTIQ